MRIQSKKFKAHFRPLIHLWEIKIDKLHFWCKHLRIKKGKKFIAPKNKYQIITAENVELEMYESWLVLLSYKNLKKQCLWELYNPDQPRNLAKSVTVR